MTAGSNSVTRTIKSQAIVLGGAVAIMWLVYLATWMTGGGLLYLGVIPRTTLGLRGIIFAPFLHGSVAHLIANSVPFVMLGWFVMLRDSRHFVPVTIAAMLGSGLMAWMFGAPGSVHVGASGVIFGYLGFLMLSGWYARSIASIVISILVTVMWGGLVFGVVPGQVGISWQAHFGGLVGGILAARAYRVRPL
jgi:membrane associated rhomboid family serine protease